MSFRQKLKSLPFMHLSEGEYAQIIELVKGEIKGMKKDSLYEAHGETKPSADYTCGHSQFSEVYIYGYNNALEKMLAKLEEGNESCS